MRGWAEFSPDKRFRFILGREWDAALPRLSWGLLNPSTAGAEEWDPTARKVRGSFEIWNLYPFIATKPAELRARLRADDDVLGVAHTTCGIPTANAVIVASAVRCHRVVVGWGAVAVHPKIEARVRDVVMVLDGLDLWCAGLTGGGHPNHPLMLAYNTPLERYHEKMA